MGGLKTFTSIPNTVFDAIVGADILHHVDMPKYLSLLFKALKPGGSIAFSEPNAWHIPWYIHWARERIPWHIEKGALQCTLPNLIHKLHHTGYEHIRIQGHGIVPTRLLTHAPLLCRFNALMLGNYPVTRLFAFRFIISADKR